MIDWQTGPLNRWAFQKVDEIVPVATISRGSGELAPLFRDLPRLQAHPEKGLTRFTSAAPIHEVERLIEDLESTYTDALVVVHDGELVIEHYANGMMPATRHLVMSVSKSFVGVLVGQAVEEGVLQEEQYVSLVLPELTGSAYGSATIREVLDMAVAVDFSEDYGDPSSEVQRQDRVAGWRDRMHGDPRDTYELLRTLRSSGKNGEVFQYCSAGSDVLAWVLERVYGTSYPELLQEKLWEKLGVASDAYITVDPGGFAAANGGLCVTARDLAVFGQTVLEGSGPAPQRWLARTLGEEACVAPGAEVGAIAPDLRYKGHFWHVGRQNGSLMGWGIYGQYLYMDPQRKVVIVKFSTEPEADSIQRRRRHLSLFSRLVNLVAHP